MVLALRPDTNSCRLWKMMARGTPEPRGEFSADMLVEEITRRQEQWRPSEVLRAKNVAFPDVSPQLDFYDVGLVAAIEADVHRKLNELLSTVVAQSREIYLERHDQEPGDQTYRALFQLIFRFMAAKLLGDRRHEGDWLNANALIVLRAVNAFYNDPAATLPALDDSIRNRAWDTIRTAIHFQNLSVEALAYVYENTFVDITTRRTLGTHATPYEIAEYMVGALPIQDLPQDERTVFEPFCGAAPFLIAALSRLRELLLPADIEASVRHSYFVKMLSGMEVDPFAREVAFHSLILADYPNSNGWKLLEEDVFTSPLLTDNIAQANIVLCNPPYGAFRTEEKQAYLNLNSTDKDVEALFRVLQHPPKMLGFVLPRTYTNGRSYKLLRERVESLYGNVDQVVLPDSVFKHSDAETVLLLAYDKGGGPAQRRSIVLSKPEYQKFIYSKAIQWGRHPLQTLWEEVSNLTSLSAYVDVHRGIEYKEPFSAANSRFVSDVKKPNFVPGLVRADNGFSAYVIQRAKHLTTEVPFKAGANWDWSSAKVVAPAASASRGHWATVAAVDYEGLLCTQNFQCIWQKPVPDIMPLEVIAGVLNGPVANAWISRQAGKRHNQANFFLSIPVPNFSATVTELITRYVSRYIRLQGTVGAMDILLKIDAAVLDAYGLSGEAESELLAWFDGARRPGVPGFTGYGPEFEEARAEYRNELAHFQQVERYQTLVDKTFLDGLTPQEAQEKDRLSRAIDKNNAPFYENILQELSHGR